MIEFLKKAYTSFRLFKARISDNLLGYKNYKKFVIVSDSRTGSTLLMQLLNSHPEILCFGEEFKNLRAFSCRQIWNKIYRKRPKSVIGLGLNYFMYIPVPEMIVRFGILFKLIIMW